MNARVRPLALLLGAASALLGGLHAHSQPRRTSARELVYQPRAPAVHMPHAHPAHRELPCTQCHVQPPRAAGLELPVSEQRCLPCHAAEIDRASQRCGSCHIGFDPARPELVPARAVPASRLHFSHARHRTLDCAHCHDASGERPTLPSMERCLDCHRGARALPCAGCHLAEPSGKLRTRFPEGRLAPEGGWLGIAHDADFLVRHRWLAADHGDTCRSCHVEDECAECHDGARRPRTLHPNDYLSLHARDAQRAATSCNSCHSPQSFCAACHARLGIAQLSAPDLASPRRFHPASALWSRGPVLHAREAKRSLATCTTCHAEHDCVECHAARGSQSLAGSPHPPDFSEDCARAFARNPRPCAICHRADDSRLQRCQ